MIDIENFASDVSDNASELFALVDLSYNYVYVNAAYASVFGRQVSDFSGQPVESILGSEVFSKNVKPNLDRCLSGEPTGFEAPLETAHGKACFQASYAPWHDQNGDIRGVFVSVHGIQSRKLADQQLQKALAQLQLAVDSAQLGFWRLDMATEKLYWNDVQLEIYGLSREEYDNSVETWRGFLHPDDRQFVDENFAEVATPEGVSGIDFRIIRRGGEVRHLHASGRALFDANGEITELIGINFDVTELHLNQSKYRTLVESAPICIHQINLDGELISMNQAGLRMMGVTEEKAIIGMPYLEATCVDDRPRVAGLLQAAFQGQMSEFEFKGSNGVEFSSSFVPIPGSDGQVERLLGLTQDVTERNQAQRELEFRASHDNLTGLINRSEFERRLERLLSSRQLPVEEHALCFMDLDEFKVVNDTCGHAAGDELLRQLGTSLKAVVRHRDTLARLGGDEFGVLMEHCTLQQAHRTVAALQQVVNDFRFSWEGRYFQVGVSIGMVAIDDHIDDVSELLKRADAACYLAKDAGRNQIMVYQQKDSVMRKRRGQMEWVSLIHDALQEDRFELYAQRIESLRGTDNHYELLLRMRGVDNEILAPAVFIPAAERFSLMQKIDKWVLDKAFAELNHHHDIIEGIDCIAINLSGQSLSSAEILDLVVSAVDELEIEAGKICFEITETAAIANLGIAMKFISTLKGFGFRFSLDDFGTGLSSFSYLKNLPVDYLKIDGQFVRNMASDRISYAMVRSINDIGHLMGLQTIAEFVESDAIRMALLELEVDFAQGYAIEKPGPFGELLAELKQAQ